MEIDFMELFDISGEEDVFNIEFFERPFKILTRSGSDYFVYNFKSVSDDFDLWYRMSVKPELLVKYLLGNGYSFFDLICDSQSSVSVLKVLPSGRIYEIEKISDIQELRETKSFAVFFDEYLTDDFDLINEWLRSFENSK